MARTFPDSPQGVLPPAVLQTFRFLKSLPDNWLVWHHLAPWQKDTPDFLILNAEKQALLVKVSSAATSDAHPVAQMLLLQDDRARLGEAETQVLRAYRGSLQDTALLQGLPFPLAVVFPNIPEHTLAGSRPDGALAWLGKEAIQPGGELAWAGLFDGTPLDGARLEALRSHFTPEVVVPPALTVRGVQGNGVQSNGVQRNDAQSNGALSHTNSTRRLEAGLACFLLDYDQEAALKADLDLDDDGQSLSKDFRLSVVNGVAGSGKTLILLYRLRMLHALYPGKRYLVLTHNRPLIRDMEARFHRLTGSLPGEITWNTFNGWCYNQWPASPRWVSPLGEKPRRDILRSIWMEFFKSPASSSRLPLGSDHSADDHHSLPEGSHPADVGDLPPDGRHLADTRRPPISENMLRSEIDWFKDQVFSAPEEYLTAERRGRGFRLTQEQRLRMFQAIQRYQQVLQQNQQMDWGDVPRRLWEFAQAGKVSLPEYDVVLVDEAQFFAPLWFEIIRRLVKPRSGHLFIAADPTQGFLGRGTSWKSLGLEVRGHTQQLERSYRTTREILSFATLFYRQRIATGQADEDILAADLADMPFGALPEMLPLTSPQDEITRVTNEIAAFASQGMPLKHLLVLHANWHGVDALNTNINRKLGKDKACDPKDQYPGDYVRVTTLNAGTGLESPIVFLVGLNKLFEEEQSLRLSDEEREALIFENTRKVYMAATRAGQRLVFTYVGEMPAMLRGLFNATK
jgi:superfamily I DNA/RNA helicase